MTYSPALPLQVTRKFGLGNLGLRCLPALARLGRIDRRNADESVLREPIW
ncbi:hypothetical protein [Leptolyngbya ohadii]|nr:hypothetical protein [Leptolyngbya ohadii]